MPQKRQTVDQIVAKLRKADVELGKGKTHSSDLSAVTILISIGGAYASPLTLLDRHDKSSHYHFETQKVVVMRETC